VYICLHILLLQARHVESDHRIFVFVNVQPAHADANISIPLLTLMKGLSPRISARLEGVHRLILVLNLAMGI
jgi:hypothetical protein